MTVTTTGRTTVAMSSKVFVRNDKRLVAREPCLSCQNRFGSTRSPATSIRASRSRGLHDFTALMAFFSLLPVTGSEANTAAPLPKVVPYHAAGVDDRSKIFFSSADTHKYSPVRAGEYHRSIQSTSTTDGTSDEGSKPWLAVLLATLLVNVASLSAVIFLIPVAAKSSFCFSFIKKRRNDRSTRDKAPKEGHGKMVDIAMPSFACGALLAAAFFLIIPESIELIGAGRASSYGDHGRYLEDHANEDHADEDHADEFGAAVSWKFGTAVLTGFLIPLIIGSFFSRATEHACDEDCNVSDNVDNKNSVPPHLASSAACDNVNATAAAHTLHDGVTGSVESKCSSHHNPTPRKDKADSSHFARKSDHPQDSLLPAGESNTECAHDAEEHSDCNLLRCNLTRNEKTEVDSPKTGRSKSFGSDLENVLNDDRRHNNDESIKVSPTIASTRTGVHSTRKTRSAIDWKLCTSVLIGDGFHNFADGVFIGIGFLLCSADVAFTIMGVTFYHEVAQELADYFLLTKHAGLPIKRALLLNFISGFTVILGGITILALDLSSQAIGIVLGIAAGVYIHIGAGDCIPRVNAAVYSKWDRLLSFVMFAVGAVPIGLALLKHSHCEG